MNCVRGSDSWAVSEVPVSCSAAFSAGRSFGVAGASAPVGPHISTASNPAAAAARTRSW